MLWENVQFSIVTFSCSSQMAPAQLEEFSLNEMPLIVPSLLPVDFWSM